MTYQEHFNKTIIPEVMKVLGFKNPMRAPRVEKIIVSSCLKEALQDAKILDRAAAELGQITGQKPVITKAKKSIAAFKLRKGVSIGCKVTLRKKRMYEFLNRLINVALPRMRDFKGVSDKAFDGRGNYTLGLTEQIVFPEIQYDKIDKIRGMNVTIVTTARNDQEGRALLKALGMPFKEAGSKES
ncbi:MAG: 50S ribosomal protein L5 [Deltaproteobacteria bacterium]|nr:50S ribosomal protein L5 [Deltaproteobacteria bacterium]